MKCDKYPAILPPEEEEDDKLLYLITLFAGITVCLVLILIALTIYTFRYGF